MSDRLQPVGDEIRLSSGLVISTSLKSVIKYMKQETERNETSSCYCRQRQSKPGNKKTLLLQHKGKTMTIVTNITIIHHIKSKPKLEFGFYDC